jgi:hypothetical protein
VTLSGRPSRSASELLDRLARLRLRFDEYSGGEKQAILKQLGRVDIINAPDLMTYHDRLCFIRAFPDSPQLLKLTRSELWNFGRRVKKYREASGDKRGRKLDNSGIVDTTTRHTFGYELTRMLISWHARSLVLDWRVNESSLAERILDLLPLLVAWQENDALGLESDLDAARWLDRARGSEDEGNLETFVRLLSLSPLSAPTQEHLFEDLGIDVSWRLDASPASRTLKRIGAGRRYYQRGPLKRRTPDLGAELVKPASPLRALNRREGERYVRAVNEVMAIRNRELHPVTSANPAEVYLNQPGRGLTIAVFGMHPEVRLPLESNFGALLVRNGMPIGYGVAAVLFDRVEIAINVFPAFRSGESSFIIEQYFRLFYHHFGSRTFLVRKRQMGYGDDEALRSGAFWFYYKLGFRAVDSGVRRLAEKEHQRMGESSNFQVPLRTMRRLSASDVVFHADPAQAADWEDISTENLAGVVTDFFADKWQSDRRRGLARTVAAVTRVLNLRDFAGWSRREVTVFERMAPLLANIEGLKNWSTAEKNGLVKIVQAKGARRERRFVLLSCRHRKFQSAVRELAGSEKRSK